MWKPMWRRGRRANARWSGALLDWICKIKGCWWNTEAGASCGRDEAGQHGSGGVEEGNGRSVQRWKEARR
jgi:hypothetical protein